MRRSCLLRAAVGSLRENLTPAKRDISKLGNAVSQLLSVRTCGTWLSSCHVAGGPQLAAGSQGMPRMHGSVFQRSLEVWICRQYRASATKINCLRMFKVFSGAHPPHGLQP